MYQNRHFKCLTAFQKEKKETTMNLRKKLLDKKKKIIKFGKKNWIAVLVTNVQGNRYYAKTKYTANILLSLKRSNKCLTTHRLLF